MYDWLTVIMFYVCMGTMLCAAMKECQETGKSGPLIDFLNNSFIP